MSPTSSGNQGGEGRSFEKPVVEVSLLQETARAISQLNPERAMQVLVENAVSVTEAGGAILMIPHEKLREMVPLVELLPEKAPIARDAGFSGKMFHAFSEARETGFQPSELPGLGFGRAGEVGPALAIPVNLSGRPVALIFIFLPPGRVEFTPESRTFLEILSPFMGAVIENFRLTNEMLHKNSRLSALYEISQRTESLVSLSDVFDALEKILKSFIDFDAYLLYLLSPDGQTLEAKAGNPNGPFPNKVSLGESPLGKAALDRKPYLTYTAKFNSVLILPIIVSEKLIGIVTIGSRKSYAYRDEDIIGIRIIATQLASIDEMFKDLVQLKGFTQHILESMTAGVLIFDKNANVTFVNPEMKKLLGQPAPENLSAINADQAFPEPLKKLITEVLETKSAIENRRVRWEKNGQASITEVNAFPFRDEQGFLLGTAFFLKDITQITRLEEQLMRADRLSALGVLAAGIAHEIRNPLTGMKMIVQLLAGEFGEGDPKREPLGIIQNEIERLQKIIVNLLDFARPSPPQAVPISLPEILKACLLLVQNQIAKLGIRLEQEVVSDPPVLIGDPNQLKQVFLNILTNSIQASHSGGVIGVKTEYKPEGVVVAIRDTGTGIPESRIRSIFDPFMTTKEDGTGLGLSLALRIVEEHGGRIDVESREGAGSTFSVFLPLVHPQKTETMHV